MSSTSADVVTFVDTNVLVYAYDRDQAAKHHRAVEVITELWDERQGVVSTQVLQEFYVTVTRKLPRPLSRTDVCGSSATLEATSKILPQQNYAVHHFAVIAAWSPACLESLCFIK